MRGIARTAALGRDARHRRRTGAAGATPRAGSVAREAFLAVPTRSSVELGTDEIRTGGGARGSSDAPGPSFLGLTSACQAGLASR